MLTPAVKPKERASLPTRVARGNEAVGSELANSRRCLKLPVVIEDRFRDLLVSHDSRHIGVVGIDGEADSSHNASDDGYHYAYSSRAVTLIACRDQRKGYPRTLQNASNKTSMPEALLPFHSQLL